MCLKSQRQTKEKPDRPGRGEENQLDKDARVTEEKRRRKRAMSRTGLAKSFKTDQHRTEEKQLGKVALGTEEKQTRDLSMFVAGLSRDLFEKSQQNEKDNQLGQDAQGTEENRMLHVSMSTAGPSKGLLTDRRTTKEKPPGPIHDYRKRNKGHIAYLDVLGRSFGRCFPDRRQAKQKPVGQAHASNARETNTRRLDV